MKVLLGVILLAVVIGAVAYFSGMFSMVSPEEQAKRFREVAVAGATWQQVADASEPKRFRVREKITLEMRSMTPGVGAENKFERQAFKEAFDEGQYPEGFLFEYAFSAADQFAVYFDSSGRVIGLEKHTTMKDLLGP